jgi:mono/diheme cytochrome c family protein
MKTPSRKVSLTIAVACLAGAIMGSWRCGAAPTPARETNSPIPEVRANGGVHSITLPHFEPEMPAAAGREAFLAVCDSCHSPRYVVMQPPFSQHQWEATVDKMAKVYGAQMDDDQRRAIIDYLASTHGPDAKPNAAAVSGNDDSDFLSAPRVPTPVEKFPPITASSNTAELASSVSRGADLFKQDCAACHGAEGRGDGVIAPVLLPKPANLFAIRFSLERLSQVLWNGVRGTTMPSWRGLPPGDLRALAEYVQTLHPPADSTTPEPAPSEHARNLFTQNCAACHGLSGDGKGAAAATLMPPPASFKLNQPDFDLILKVLREGIPGTAMPAGPAQLSESDRAALAGFVRSIYEPAKAN